VNEKSETTTGQKEESKRFYEKPEVRKAAGLLGEALKEAAIICLTASLAALSSHYTSKYLEEKTNKKKS
jgi:hypothetical protein